jgi:integral membrane protein
MAWATGVLLLALVLVAMPMKYVGDDEHLVELIGPIHGWLYLFYVVTAVMLALQLKWRLGRTLLIVVAGTVPFASFAAERAVVAEARRHQQAGSAQRS